MKLKLSSACLLVWGAAAGVAFAQDHSDYLKQLQGKTALMKQCASLAVFLEQIPVPPNHADAKAVVATNVLLKLQTKPQVDPVHMQFEATVKAKDQEFERCGDQLFKDLAPIEAKLKPFMATVKAQKMTEAEQKALSATVAGYMNGKQELHKAVELLSKDIQMQAYVQKTLMQHYLNQKY